MIDTQRKTVLLSPIGGQAIYGIVKYFREHRFEVIGIDRNPEALGRQFAHKFIVVPDVNAPSYADSLLKIVRDNKVGIFISWLDAEIVFWNNKFYSKKMPREMIAVSTFNFHDEIMRFYDKFMFSSYVADARFCSPKTALLSKSAGTPGICFPAIIKPRIGTGAKDVFIVKDQEALKYCLMAERDKFRDMDRFIIQEFIRGQEYTVDFFAVKGDIHNIVVRRRIEHRGVSLKGEVVYSSSIEEVVRRFASSFNIDGLNNIQVIESDGKIFIIEFNPRPSGTIMLSVNAGVDFFKNIFEWKANKKITRYSPPKKLKMVRYLSEFYYE